MTSEITAFFKKISSLSKLQPVEELTPPASQDSASSDSTFRLELLPSHESVASDSLVESKQNVSSQSEPTVLPIVSFFHFQLLMYILTLLVSFLYQMLSK